MPERRLVLALVAQALMAISAGCSGQTAGDSKEEADNPWGHNPVTVHPTTEDLETPVHDALTWWEYKGDRYHDHDVEFKVVDDDGADIKVKSGTGPCVSVGAVGCYVETCYNGECEHVVAVDWFEDDSERVDVLKHEFGHALGLEHGEGPSFMSEFH